MVGVVLGDNKMSRKYGTTSSRRQRVDELQPAVGYSKHVKLLQFLFQEYGSFEFIMDIGESIIDLLKRFYVGKKKYQKTLMILKYGIPAAVFISDFVSKIKRYRSIKSGKNTVSNESIEKFRELFNIGESVSVDNYPFTLGGEVTRWLLQRPKTKSFQILGYYQFDNLQPIADTYREDDSTLITAIEMGGSKYAWMIRMYRNTEDDLYLRFSDIFTTMDSISKINELKGKIFREFIEHFDVVNNVLLFSTGGLSTYPRQSVLENPVQYDTKRWSNEIRKVLKRGKKRGWVLVGIPGTGKSTIIHCLEHLITDFPIIYLSSSCFSSVSMVKETFNTLRYIQPCVAVVEDLDSCELKDKRQALGELLEQVDDVDNTLNIVLVTSVNDTSLVHYSLINRPGRLDEVILVSTPKTKEEVYDILKCRYYKNKIKDPEIKGEFITYKNINHEYLQNILDKKYTQADICEIVEKALLIDSEFTEETFKNSLESLENSKRALKECDFGGVAPYMCEEYPKDCTEDCIDPKENYGGTVYPANKSTGRAYIS